PLFDFLASEASAAQIDYFFKSDSALNLLFFDLVAMGLVGSLPETRAEIAQNLWDEIGQGSTEITHVNLYKDLLKRRNIALPDNHFAHLYEW
ncbi:iron-containing redox enzyme family protein, partial [Klebsiella pneumoniae]